MLTVALLSCGADPSYAIGGDLNSTGLNAAGRDRRPLRRRGRRERRRVPGLLAARRGRHQRRRRPPRPLRHRGGYRAAFTRVPRPDRPGGFLVAWPTTRAPRTWPREARDRGLRVHDVRRLRRRRPARRLTCGRPAAPRRSRSTRDGERARRGDAADPGPPLRPRRAGRARRRPRARASASTTWPPGWRRSPGPVGGWSARARPPGCGSTTATPTTRARSAATSRRPGRSPATAGWWSPSSRTWSRRTRIFGARDGRGARRRRRGRRDGRLPRPRGPRARGHRRAGRRRRPAAAGARALRAATSTAVPALLAALARPGDLVLTLGAGDVTTVGPRVLELLGDAGVSDATHRGDVPTTSPRRLAQAVRPPAAGRAAGWPGAGSLAVAGRPGARGRRRAGCSSSRPRSRCEGVEVQGTDGARRRRGGRGGRRTHRSGRWPGSTSTRSTRPGRGAGPGRVRRRVARSWPDQVRIERHGARPRSRWSTSRAALRGMDAEGVVFRDYDRSAGGAAAGDRCPAAPGDEALAEVAAVVGALPSGWLRRVEFVEVPQRSTRSRLHLRDGRRGEVGERRTIRRQGRGARRAPASATAGPTTSPSPVSPPPSQQ